MKLSVIQPQNLKENQDYVRSQIGQLQNKKLLVVGDLCLDKYILGEVRRISPEAPVPVVEVTGEESRIGLAANVAQNIISLGGQVSLVGVIGEDNNAAALRDLLTEAGVDSSGLIADSTRPTTCKTRIMAENNHIVRVDHEHRRFLSADTEAKLLANVEKLMPDCDGVILQDYAKGVFSEASCQRIIEISKEHNKKVCVDPHRTTPIHYYRGADLFKPNREEAFILSELNIDDLRQKPDSIVDVANSLIEKVNCSQLVITRGKEGMSLFDNSHGVTLPTYARQVFDVTGAGDTVIAALALGWAAGFNLEQACVLANLAAGVVVGKVGCVPCTKEELLQHLSLIEKSQ